MRQDNHWGTGNNAQAGSYVGYKSISPKPIKVAVSNTAHKMSIIDVILGAAGPPCLSIIPDMRVLHLNLDIRRPFWA